MIEDIKQKLSINKIIYFSIVIVLLIVAYNLYKNYERTNFNDFVIAEYKQNISEYIRDDKVKYSDNSSYKLSSKEVNDIMFYKTINVIPNTPYKVTCMVKTEDIKTVKEVSNAGAQISVLDTVERSKSITGTNDWQKLEFIFNSKNRTSVSVGFRLGGYDDDCTGTAWFSDFTIESGSRI